MTAQEAREYRNMCKKLVEAEERSKLLKELVRKNVSFNEDEIFIGKTQSKFRVLGEKEGEIKKGHNEMVKFGLKFKLKDNKLHAIKMRRRKDWLRHRLESTLGGKSKEFLEMMEDVKKKNMVYRKLLMKKNQKKVKDLTQKYGRQKYLEGWEVGPRQ